MGKSWKDKRDSGNNKNKFKGKDSYPENFDKKIRGDKKGKRPRTDREIDGFDLMG